MHRKELIKVMTKPIKKKQRKQTTTKRTSSTRKTTTFTEVSCKSTLVSMRKQ